MGKKVAKEFDTLRKHCGVPRVHMTVMEDHFHTVHELFGEMIIVRCEYPMATQSFEYHVLWEELPELEDGYVMPVYKATIDDEGCITVPEDIPF